MATWRWYDKPVAVTKLRQILMHPDNRPMKMIAERAGIPLPRVSEYSLGRKPIPIHHVLALCQALDVTPAQLLGTVDPTGDSNVSASRTP